MTEKPWFKLYPSDFLNGVVELTPDELAVYTIVIMLIYDRDGPIFDDYSRIAKRCNMPTRRCQAALNALVETHEKLVREDGFLKNAKAAKVIEKRRNFSQKQANNVNRRWEKEREKANKINRCSV